MNSPSSLWICVTCRLSLAPGVAATMGTDGRDLFELTRSMFANHPVAQHIALKPVECMSGCDRSCTVGLTAVGKPSYLFGDLRATPDHALAVLDCAHLYATRVDGELPRVERPSAMRKGILARLRAPTFEGTKL